MTGFHWLRLLRGRCHTGPTWRGREGRRRKRHEEGGGRGGGGGGGGEGTNEGARAGTETGQGEDEEEAGAEVTAGGGGGGGIPELEACCATRGICCTPLNICAKRTADSGPTHSMGGPMEMSEATEDSQSVALKGLTGNLSSTGYLDVADEELTALLGPPLRLASGGRSSTNRLLPCGVRLLLRGMPGGGLLRKQSLLAKLKTSVHHTKTHAAVNM